MAKKAEVKEDWKETSKISQIVTIVVVAVLVITGMGSMVYSFMAQPTASNSSNSTQAEVKGVIDNSVKLSDNKNMTDTLVMEDIVVGQGDAVVAGDTITVHYTGWLTNGTKFDSSVDRGEPFTTKIGVGRVIQGWDEGMVGMKIGGKRKLTIPASMGYGDRAVSVIPANSTLIFEVELLRIMK